MNDLRDGKNVCMKMPTFGLISSNVLATLIHTYHREVVIQELSLIAQGCKHSEFPPFMSQISTVFLYDLVFRSILES